MRQLSPEERRRWQSTTLAAPRRRYGAGARLLLPQLIAFAVYQQFWLLRVLKPAWSYRLNADTFRQIGCD